MSKVAKKNLQALVLLVDMRECERIRDLFLEGIQRHQVLAKVCAVGDLWICRRKGKEDNDDDDVAIVDVDREDPEVEPLLILERKTWSDYLSSLHSGRLHEQRSRLLQTGCRVGFLIEGERLDYVGYRQTERRKAEAFLLHSQVRDHVGVYYTDNPADSIDLVQRLMDRMEDKTFLGKATRQVVPVSGTDRETESLRSYVECQKMSTRNLATPRACYISQLAMLPNVSHDVAVCISKLYPDMREFADACASELRMEDTLFALSDMRVHGDTRFGVPRSRMIIEYMNGGRPVDDELVKEVDRKTKRIAREISKRKKEAKAAAASRRAGGDQVVVSRKRSAVASTTEKTKRRKTTTAATAATTATNGSTTAATVVQARRRE